MGSVVKEPGSHWAWSSGLDPAIILGSVGLNPLKWIVALDVHQANDQLRSHLS